MYSLKGSQAIDGCLFRGQGVYVLKNMAFQNKHVNATLLLESGVDGRCLLSLASKLQFLHPAIQACQGLRKGHLGAVVGGYPYSGWLKGGNKRTTIILLLFVGSPKQNDTPINNHLAKWRPEPQSNQPSEPIDSKPKRAKGADCPCQHNSVDFHQDGCSLYRLVSR